MNVSEVWEWVYKDLCMCVGGQAVERGWEKVLEGVVFGKWVEKKWWFEVEICKEVSCLFFGYYFKAKRREGGTVGQIDIVLQEMKSNDL